MTTKSPPVKKIPIDPAIEPRLHQLTWFEYGGQTAVRITQLLDRSTYEAVNKVLEALGGQWNRKAKGHLFPQDPRPELEVALGNGAVVVEKDGFFPTPKDVVLEMVRLLPHPIPTPILEPSAGEGALCDVLCELGYAPNDILALEKNGRRRQLLYDKGYVCEEADFLAWKAEQFPTVLMNPPFEQGQDIVHVTHAFTHCLQPGGQLVAVVSEGPFFRQEQKAVVFRDLVDSYGYSLQLPANSFKTSGTAVNTRLVYLRKPAEKTNRPVSLKDSPMQTTPLTLPTQTAPLNQLRAHPAQMRTRYDLDELAALTLQVYQRGLDAWHPILVSPIHGANQTEGTEGYHIVSGHRRYIAYVLAQAYLTAHTLQTTQTPDGEEVTTSLELIGQFIGQLVEKHGTLETAVSELLTFLGQEKISVLLFEGSPKAEILSLQAANYGGEKPDRLGIAHSFHQALEAGATLDEIARNCGQHTHYVENHLALTQIPPELAQLIADEALPMSVATVVADLPEPKRTGFAIFLLANDPKRLIAKDIKAWAATLKKWPGLQLPLFIKYPSQRNVARALVRLWNEAVGNYPQDAYAAATMFICHDAHEEPWAHTQKYTLWFEALGGEAYFQNGRIQWTAVLAHLLPEISCATCPIAQLPPQRLHCDLSHGKHGLSGLPCRTGETAIRCLHGLTPDDPVLIPAPWEWSEHPGVVYDGGYCVKSLDDLMTAWQAQAEVEGGGEKGEEREDVADSEVCPPGYEDELETRHPSTGFGQALKPETPIVKQRTLIADYMKQHETLTVSHPMATPCGRCQHRLETSPTKDEAVPHCRWAGRLRTVMFNTLRPSEGDGPVIPVCRQFAPSQPWQDLIPAHAQPPGMPRDWLKENLLLLVKAANSTYNGDFVAFEFLIGRPMKKDERYSDWFQKQLEEQIGDLSDAQLFTLFVWAVSEWQRARERIFSLPVNGNGLQFGRYQEQRWQVKE